MARHTPMHKSSPATSAAVRGIPALIAVLLSLALVVSGFLTRPASAAEPADPAAAVSVTLGYPDGQPHAGGVTVQPGEAFSGTININTTSTPTKDATNLKVTLRVPKAHISSLKIDDFTDATVGESTQTHTISEVTTEGDDDVITVTWPTFYKGASLSIPFDLTLANGETPDGFVVKPVATITSDQNPTAVTSDPLTITARYPQMTLTKTANGKNADGTTVVGTGYAATTTGSDGTTIKYIDEDSATLVSFSFTTQVQGNRRTLTSATLTDTLPTYTDYKGNTRTAAFDAALNDGWTLSADGKSVSYTKTGKSDSLANEFPTLRLSFPGLVLSSSGTHDGNDYDYATLTNSATVTTTVSDPMEGEKTPTASDSITINVASGGAASVGGGNLWLFSSGMGQSVQGGYVADTTQNKKKNFEWNFDARQESQYSMNGVELHDEAGAGCASGTCGPDKRLKVTALSSISITGLSAAEVVAAIQSVRAYKDDGSYDTYTPSAASSTTASVTFDSGTTYAGFSIIFKPDWLWKPNVHIYVYAASYLRDPSSVHYVENSSTNKISNTGCLKSNSVLESPGTDGKTTETVISTTTSQSTASYTLKKFNEEMHIHLDGGTVTQNTTFMGITSINGVLDAEKTYENPRVVLMLPKGLEWVKYDQTASASGAPVDACNRVVKTSGITTIDNYKGSGRTAVIIPLDESALREIMSGSTDGSAWLEFDLKATKDADPEPNSNVLSAFITADNAPDPGNESGFTDFTSQLPRVAGAGVYPDKYGIGPHTTIAASAGTFTVRSLSGAFYGNQTVKSTSASSQSGINVTRGIDFTYHLTVGNVGGSKISYTRPGVSLIDVLPSRTNGSKFDVRLSSFPTTVPTGYTLLYSTGATDSAEADNPSGADGRLTWQTQAELAAAGKTAADVTAIKMVPIDTSTTIAPDTSLSLDLPVTVPSGETVDAVSASDYEDNTRTGIGLIAYLDAVNSFSYRSWDTSKADDAQLTSAVNWKAANNTYVRLGSVAGFVIKKVDASDTLKTLSGATFSLATASGTSGSTITSDPSSATTGDNGLITFYGLSPADDGTTLTGTLTETAAPANYLKADGLSISVSAFTDTLRMTCTVAGDGDSSSASESGTACSGHGTKTDPFIIADRPVVSSLPSTGGRLGMLVLAVAATFLLALLTTAGCVLLKPRKRKH